jgi:cell division protein FtsW (lipid II flippase)
MSPPRKNAKHPPRRATRTTPTRKKKAAPRKATAKKHSGGAKAKDVQPLWLHVSGVAAIVLGFLSLLSLRLANAPTLDAVAVGYIELMLGAVIIWVVFAVVARTADKSAGQLMLLLLATAFLVNFGILIQHRIKGIDIFSPTISDYAYPVGIILLIVVFLICRNGRYHLLRIPGPLYVVVSFIGMAALLLLGSRYRGAIFAAGRMTPTELLKPVMAIYLSAFLAENLSGSRGASSSKSSKKRVSHYAWLRWLWLGCSWGILMVLLLYQRDLGMVMILNGMLVCVFVAATSAYWLFPVAGVLAVVGGFTAFQLLPHVRQRVEIWLHPFAETTGSGWQLLQSLAALYNGGLLGAGFGEGSPQTIPVASSDFIYASIGEELGLVGCFLLLVIIVILLRTGFAIASSCKDRFGSLLATSLTSMLAIQTILNLGGVTKALPMTGVPLPFLSHGGTSLVVSFVSVGILAAIAASEVAGKRKR